MKKNGIFERASLFIKLIAGIGIIVILFWSFQPAELIKAFQTVSPVFIVAAGLVYIANLSLLSFRWKYIIGKVGYQLSFISVFKGFTGGILMSDITPGRIGEFGRPLTIRKSVPLHTGFLSVVLDRYCDFVLITLLGFVGIFLLSARFTGYFILNALLALIIPVVLLTLFLVRKDLFFRVTDRLNWRFLSSITEKLREAFKTFQDPHKILLIPLVLTFFSWMFQSLRMVLIALSFGYIVPWDQMIFLQPLISALSLIPISISGLGLVEGGYSFVFSLFGIPVATGLAIALLDRLVTVLIHLIFGLPATLSIIQSSGQD